MGIFDFFRQNKSKSPINKEQPTNPHTYADPNHKIDINERLKRHKVENKNRIVAGLDPEPIEEVFGFVAQHNAIVDYKNKDFEAAKDGLLKAIEEYSFYTPGGIDYLAKLYRKEKDYLSESQIIERGLSHFEAHPETNWSISKIESLRKRLTKVKELLNK